MKFTIETDDPTIAGKILGMLGGATDPIVGDQVRDEPIAAAAPAPVATPDTDDNEPLVDSEGMPWDPAVHAETKGVNKDGTWKARKGKAAEAKAARAAWKASGGNVEPPADIEERPPVVAPAAPPVAAMPTPTPVPPAAPSPVPTTEQVVEQLTAAFSNGIVTTENLAEIYGNAGITNVADPMPEVEANEEIRRRLAGELNRVAAHAA